MNIVYNFHLNLIIDIIYIYIVWKITDTINKKINTFYAFYTIILLIYLLIIHIYEWINNNMSYH